MLSHTRQHDVRATIRARASWRSQRARRGGLAGIRIRRRLPRVTGTGCSDFLADKFRELYFTGKGGDNNAKNMGNAARLCLYRMSSSSAWRSPLTLVVSSAVSLKS